MEILQNFVAFSEYMNFRKVNDPKKERYRDPPSGSTVLGSYLEEPHFWRIALIVDGFKASIVNSIVSIFPLDLFD